MDADLQDLLIVWQGGENPSPERCATLLARLRGDDAFRRTFVEEIGLLGMLKAVQAPEPRWLRLEDELGWSRHEPTAPEALAEQVMQTVRVRRRRRRLVGWALAAAVLLALAAGFVFLHSPSTPKALPNVVRVKDMLPLSQLATAIVVENVQWDSEIAPLEERSIVTSGPLRFRSGRLTLAFHNGVTLTVAGPADLELRSTRQIFCRRGQLRARVPPGAEGFTVLTPGYEVVDLGTEFGLNLEADGKADLMVFEGEVALSVLGMDGHSVRSTVLEGPKVVQIDPLAAQIEEITASAERFVCLPTVAPPVLDLSPTYAAEIRAAKPWGYWRFEKLVRGLVANEVAGRPPLRAEGGVQLASAPGCPNHWAVFQRGDPQQAFQMVGDWTPPRAAGYALEVWVQPTLPGSDFCVHGATFVALTGMNEGPPEKHAAFLELNARSRYSLHEPCRVRFLDRWPAGASKLQGDNVFSPHNFVPAFWHHLVAQKAGGRLELYIDGQLAGTSPASGQHDDAPGPCQLLVGRLKRTGRFPPNGDEVYRLIDHLRPFEGHLDELAVYDRPLTTAEIQRHFQGRNLQGQKIP